MRNFINLQDATNLLYPADMRKLDMIDKQGEDRDNRIAKLQKEYFEDEGTFMEFVQNIEIDIYNFMDFKNMHSNIINNKTASRLAIGGAWYMLFDKFCEDRAIKDEAMKTEALEE